jgi:hypothetical protein
MKNLLAVALLASSAQAYTITVPDLYIGTGANSGLDVYGDPVTSNLTRTTFTRTDLSGGLSNLSIKFENPNVYYFTSNGSTLSDVFFTALWQPLGAQPYLGDNDLNTGSVWNYAFSFNRTTTISTTGSFSFGAVEAPTFSYPSIPGNAVRLNHLVQNNARRSIATGTYAIDTTNISLGVTPTITYSITMDTSYADQLRGFNYSSNNAAADVTEGSLVTPEPSTWLLSLIAGVSLLGIKKNWY